MTLSNCRELFKLKICAPRAGVVELDAISSITSTNIRKIVFTQSPAFREIPVNDTYWSRLDDILCRLADRLGCHLLEVEFLRVQVWRLNFEKYLPTFREKGLVRIVTIGD